MASQPQSQQSPQHIFITTPTRSVIDIMDESGMDSIGSCVLSNWADGVFLRNLYVHDEYRKQGIATALVNRVLDTAGCPVYLNPIPWADSPMTTSELCAWYRSLGFELVVIGEGENASGVAVWRAERMKGQIE